MNATDGVEGAPCTGAPPSARQLDRPAGQRPAAIRLRIAKKDAQVRLIALQQRVSPGRVVDGEAMGGQGPVSSAPDAIMSSTASKLRCSVQRTNPAG